VTDGGGTAWSPETGSSSSAVPRRFRVAITIDAEHPDRPTDPGAAARLVDALATDAIPATFFVQGRWAEAEPALARRLVDDGHLVGNHSHHHARFTILTRAGIERDVRAAEAAIRDAAGIDPRPWFRCPFGAGARTARVVDTLAALGYVDVGWDVDPRDWAGARSATLERRIVQGAVERGDGAVVLLHSWPTATALAVPAAARRLRDLGAELVRIDALETLPGRRSAAAVATP
jgi:peptidoglycan/xylan/chitin deacetylase (PgdA/CDA1 family)